jgi:hypothetical protein
MNNFFPNAMEGFVEVSGIPGVLLSIVLTSLVTDGFAEKN